jgi:hypothetical protein
MPNWCYNTLIVSGSAKEVEKFVLENQGKGEDPLLFSKSVPEPTYEGYTDSSSKTDPDGLPDWCQWRLANWGTKWEPNSAGSVVIEEHKINNQPIKTANYQFETAWGPADVWFKRVIVKYKNLKFCLTYSEEGGDFGGAFVAVGGKIAGHAEDESMSYIPSKLGRF